MAEKKFVDGLIVKKPHENAPGFILCNISIKRKELGNWLRGESDDWINVDVKISKEGKYYAEVNTWKPEGSSLGENGTPQGSGRIQTSQKPDFDDDIPF